METTYIIINMSSRFAQFAGHRQVRWVTEYPDASEWTSLAEARRALHSLRKSGHAVNIYSLIENYGLESQRTIESLDMLQ